MKSASRSGPLLLCRRDEQRWPVLLLWATRKSRRDRVQSAHSSCIPAADRQYGDGRAGDPVEPVQHRRGPGREQQSKDALDARGELVLVDQRDCLDSTWRFRQSELGR